MGRNNNKTRRRAKRPVSEQEMVEWALANIAHGIRITDLADKFGRDPAVISKAIRRAIDEGLVLIRPAIRRDRTIKRVPNLESALRTRFDKLNAAIVVDAAEFSLSAVDASGPLYDDLHRCLGEAMAAHLVEAQPFRKGDVIGIGSGRGVAYTIDALMTRPFAIRVPDVTIISLTGSVHSRRAEKKAFLDADLHSAQFSTFFNQGLSLDQVHYPLAYASPGEASAVKARTCLGEKQWQTRCPNVALVGVGVLAPGHKFYEEACASDSEQEPILAPVHKLLRELVNCSKPTVSNAYVPVADICNHLFYVPARKAQRSRKDSIRNLLSRVNDRFVTIDEEQISSIDSLILVAGTAVKAPAIHELLRRFNVRRLCTDRAAAEKILDLSLSGAPSL